MRRIITIGTAFVVLAGAAVALAAGGNFDTFGATQTFSPNTAGSNSHPVPLSVSEHWTAKGTTGGNAAPLTKIVARIYGLKYNGKDFPSCSATQINHNNGNAGKWDNVCPKGSYIGGGPVKAKVTAPSGIGSGSNCDPALRIFNGGANTQTFFFVDNPWTDKWGKVPSTDECAGATTGKSCTAYTGKLSYSGKWAVLTIVLPPCASTDAANLHLYAALQDLKVTYKKMTVRKSGKTVGYGESVACQHRQRPWSFTFTAKNYTGHTPATQTSVVSGHQAC